MSRTLAATRRGGWGASRVRPRTALTRPRSGLPSYLGFDILFEDEHLIVVNKPAHWLTIPTTKKEQNTLVHRVSDYLTKKNRGRRVLVYPAHRLDRGVSGVLVLGKTVEIAAALRKQFELHKPKRHYVAIVAGHVDQRTGTIQSYLATDERMTRHSTDDEENGELAVTHFELEKQYTNTSLMRIWLETGRRNQIRVHFAEGGHPVLGDPRYGHEQALHKNWPVERMALHAVQLAFEHPVTNEEQQFEAPLPAEFVTFLKGQRLRHPSDVPR